MTRSSWIGIGLVLFVVLVLVIERIGGLGILNPGADGDSNTTTSPSGLEKISQKITILRGCADEQFLQWEESVDKWECSNTLTSPEINNAITTTSDELELTGADIHIHKKLDVGVPGVISGLDVGEGGSYTKNADGTVILKVFTYNASSTSGSRFSEITNLSSAMTLLGDAGDRICLGGPHLFWGSRFSITTALVYTDSTQILQAVYWNGSALTNMDHMGISKDDADSLGDNVLEQSSQKEYVVWDGAIKTSWATADNQTDTIPNTGTALYWICLQVPAAGLATAPVIDEFKIRGTDFDVISGTGFPVFWGEGRVERHDNISLSAAKSPGGTGTTSINIDTNHSQTVFNFNGAGDNISFVWTLPEGIDTSNPVEVQIGYSSNSADTYTIDLSALHIPNNTAINSGVASTFTSTTDITSDAAATFYSGQSLTATKMSIRALKEGDTVSFEIQRTDTSNQFYPLTITIHFVVWTSGEHI